MNENLDFLPSNNHYPTTNTSLAAYLYLLGYELLDVTIEEFPSKFIFQADDKINDYVRLFQTAKAEGNLVLYFDAYRKCLKMTKIGKF